MKKILVVDGDKNFLTSLSISLRERGYEVDTNESASEALWAVKTKEYDYLIPDIKMNDIKGYVLAEITSSVSPKTKIILISVYVFPLGFSKYPHLVKPFRFSDLLETMEKVSHEEASSLKVVLP